jgi:hypothetical protein
MESEQVIFILLGIFALLFSIVLSFIKIDKNELTDKIHTMPGIALFRFPAYRWGTVIMGVILGILCISLGFGWL